MKETRRLLEIGRANYVNIPASFLSKSKPLNVRLALDLDGKRVTVYKL
jgi:hypothetical protein